MQYRMLTVGQFPTNCYLITSPRSRTLYVIDPGGDPDRIIAAAGKLDFDQARILLTHAHFDHIWAAPEVGHALKVAEVELDPGDWPIYNSPDNAVPPQYPFRPDRLPATAIRESADFIRLPLPGHSPGGSGFLFRDDDGAVLFSGDTLFAGCIGRTDLWGGSHPVLLDSIRTRILTLDDEVVVCPGHEETSTVGVERRTNPYIMQ